ncbi:MAG: P27 family phage terminase small subunit, partial [Lachnospiraceae bacterium]|nr:P27 family phage terminase small subunit [Lachnospiraceae bacterium]
MAQSGRKPKPTAVKALEGNPGKRSLKTGEPKPEKKAPRCPAWLEGEAKKEWKRMAGQKEKLGILTEIDMAAFAGYCQA